MPGREAEDFHIDIQVEVLRAYLERSESHRDIQRKILGLPAPNHGGGFVTMSILHNYDIHENRKGILAKKTINEELSHAKGRYYTGLKLLQEVEAFQDKVKDIVMNPSIDYAVPEGTIESLRNARNRLAQSTLRNIVLADYVRCALCEVDERELLICSHIIPWAIDKKNRLNPSNAICFCAWHDKLFDRGYFTFDDRMNVQISTNCPNYISNSLSRLTFSYPRTFPPKAEFLAYHRVNILRRK
ncbi:MAG: hypothetical protein FVQ79_09430 [Planctomycetes bacterium]|nr:hypothetical protein [Planctomycetota bacterium]